MAARGEKIKPSYIFESQKGSDQKDYIRKNPGLGPGFLRKVNREAIER